MVPELFNVFHFRINDLNKTITFRELILFKDTFTYLREAIF
jgi:hypothetical protein